MIILRLPAWARPPSPSLGILVGVFCLLLAPAALRIPLDNRVEVFLDQSGDAMEEYRTFLNTFGSDEFIIAAYGGGDVLQEDLLDVQLDVHEAVEALPHVNRVSSVAGVYRDLFGEEDSEALREELRSPFYEGFLLSEDGEVAAMMIETEPPAGLGGRRDLVDEIRVAMVPLETQGFEVHLVGPPVLHVIMEETTEAETLRTFPMALVASIVMLLLLMRSIKATVIALLSVALTLSATMGLMSLFGVGLNMVTSALPMLLAVLALANLIHILRRYMEDLQPEEASVDGIRRAIDLTIRPCTLAAFTTSMGFLALLSSKMLPLRQLGIFAALGLLLSLTVSLTFTPWMVALLGVPGISKGAVWRSWGASIADWVMRNRIGVLLTSCCVTGAALWGITQIRVESDPLKFLPESSQAVASYEFVEEELTGMYALEVVIQMGEKWLHEATWKTLDETKAALEKLPGVAHVISPMDYLRQFNRWNEGRAEDAYVLPSSGSKAISMVEGLESNEAVSLRRFVSEDGKTVRLSVLMTEMDSAKLDDISLAAEELLDGLPSPSNGVVTGMGLQIAKVQTSLLETQISSFGLSFVSVFACILLGLRSWRLTMVSLPPNILPILLALGTMGWLGISLNPATVMVASVSLGIAVDDTIHVLNAYQYLRGRNRPPYEAIRLALAKVGPSITMTTGAACIGFFALTRSAFTPVRYFGLLAGIAMIVALLCDLLVVPAILLGRKRQGIVQKEEKG